MKEVRKIYTKYRFAGSVLEVKTYDSLNIKSGGKKDGIGEFKEQNYQATNKHRREQILWLALTNFDNRDKFITLTFKDEIRDVKEANRRFKQFVQRMRYKYSDFKYLAVIEFQDKNRGGVVHYHMLAKLPFIKAKEIQDIWRNGYIKINAIEHVDNLGAYVVKYMNKDTEDTRLQDIKAYNYSKNLIKPREFKSWKPEEMQYIYDMNEMLENEKPVYVATYTSEKCGEVNIKQYNFNQNKEFRNNNKSLEEMSS